MNFKLIFEDDLYNILISLTEYKLNLWVNLIHFSNKSTRIYNMKKIC